MSINDSSPVIQELTKAGWLACAMPFFSVVIPVFNHAQYLQECLNSVLEQSLANLEVIVVDDASTDPQVWQILKPFTADARVHLYQNKSNLGISATQNYAVAQARADYIALLDCDDRLDKQALLTMWTAIQENNYPDYLFSDRRNMDVQGHALYDAVYGHVASGRGVVRDLQDRMIASHLKVIAKQAYERAGGVSDRYSGIQDWEMALAIARFGRIVYVPKVLYCHRLHGASVTQSDHRGQALKTNLLRRQYLEELWPKRPGTAASAETSANIEGPEIVHFKLADLAGKSWYCPEEVVQAWQAGAECHLDARGGQAESHIEFLSDFNSYFDRILVDRVDVACRIVGTMADPGSLISPLSASDVAASSYSQEDHS